MKQFREDIRNALEGARERVRHYAGGKEDLAVALQRWLDTAMRFLEHDFAISAQHRSVRELADEFVSIALNPDSSASSIRTARTHLVAALDDLEAVIYAHGRATAAAEKVGIAIAGTRV